MYIFTMIPDNENPYEKSHVTIETWEVSTDELIREFGNFLIACGHSKEVVDGIIAEM
jgi:hypothetical protein